MSQRKDGRWQGCIYVQGRRQYVSGATREEAWLRLHPTPRPRPPMGEHDKRLDPVIAAERKAFRTRVIEACLRASREQGWDEAYTARVIADQVSATRIKWGILGPCVYCGTWLAGTVDHAQPTALGGSNRAHNLVSACFDCNTRKWKRTPDEWLPTFPDAPTRGGGRP